MATRGWFPMDGKPADEQAAAIRQQVTERYSQIACGGGACCGSVHTSGATEGALREMARRIGYDLSELAALPQGANLCLGCGSPTSLTLLQPGQTVLDLGSGAGVDCFLASKRVGPTGRVIGVDMTDAMLQRAAAYAQRHHFANVEFRKGFIEQLPVEDHSVDLVISNCVINLSPDKARVFSEIARVLKPGGQAAISDIVLLQALPTAIAQDLEAYAGCIAGALMIDQYLALVAAVGLNIQRAQRHEYDVVQVLGCSPEAGQLLAGLPADFDAKAHVASLDMLLVKPGVDLDAPADDAGTLDARTRT